MKDREKVSVLMSCYNSQETLKDSIKSILIQTYENFEFLIIDDNSSDDTLKILKDFERSDERVKVYKNSVNIGLTKSLNILIEKSTGYYIARQDTDDISKPERFEIQYNFLKNSNFQCCTSRAIIKYSNKKIPKLSHIFPNKFVIKYKNPFIHGTLFVEKEVLHNLGGYSEEFKYAQDYKLFSDMISKNYKIKILKNPLYELNMENNISSNKKYEQEFFANHVKKGTVPN